jgi:hypothetical protein
MGNPNNNAFGFANLPEAEPEEEEHNAPAPPAVPAAKQRVYQLMKESTFQSLVQRGVPVQLSEQPSQRGYVTVYMDLTPEQRRQLEAGWSGMRTSPTFSKNLYSLASADRGRGYGSGYGTGHGSGGQRNRSRSRERKPNKNRNTRNRNRNRNRNENRNRTRNLRNRERAEQNASRQGHRSVLPDATDDQIADLLSGLRF